jgi:hypothetical protein
MLQFAVSQVAGIIAVERRQSEQAIALLSQSQKELKLLPYNPLITGVAAKTAFYLALAHAQLAQREEAHHQFRFAAPYLRAHELTELLDRARRDIGPETDQL